MGDTTYEKKMSPDGTPNPKYVDLLDEDPKISGQHFACVSFVSPGKILKSREEFMFDEYLKQWDMSKSLEKFNGFLHFISYKYKLPLETLSADMEEFCVSEKGNIFSLSLHDEYKTFLDNNEARLEEVFNKEHKFQTSTNGLKVRGSFPSQGEAELRCKMLRELDPNHDIFVCQVGVWTPWHPEAYKTGRVEYLEEELNQLMSEKNKNEQFASSEFDKRVRESKRAAIEENVRKAKENNNVLTQTINEDDELVNTGVVGIETKMSPDASLEDIKKQLFDSDTAIVDKKGTQ